MQINMLCFYTSLTSVLGLFAEWKLFSAFERGEYPLFKGVYLSCNFHLSMQQEQTNDDD